MAHVSEQGRSYGDTTPMARLAFFSDVTSGLAG